MPIGMNDGTDGILPPRQRAILDLAAEGRADKEIAAKLGISVHTVDAHWRRLRELYGASSRTQVLSEYATERVRLRLAKLEDEQRRLEAEVEALQRQRERTLAARREQLEFLTRQQNEILWTIGELMIEADQWADGLSVFRTPDAFRAAAPDARTVDFRPHAAPGANEVRPDGLTVDGVRFAGGCEHLYSLCLMDWPHMSGWARAPVVHGNRPIGHPWKEPILWMYPPQGARFFAFAFFSLTRHEPVADVWRFFVETAHRRYELTGAARPDAPGFIGFQAGEDIVSVGARCGDVCYPQIAHVAYAGVWRDVGKSRTNEPVGPL